MSEDKTNWAGVVPKNSRHQLTQEEFDHAIEAVTRKLEYRQKQKGMGTYASCHEALGVLEEEYDEYLDEVHDRNTEGQVKELIDIAVGCIWAIASINSGGQDW